MGARYLVSRVAIIASTTADTLTITAPSNRSLKIWAVRLKNESTTAAACRILMSRSTGGATPVAITPQPTHPDFAAATFTAASGWTTQPTLGVTLDRFNMTGVGATDPRPYPPGQEIEVVAGGQISFRSESGTNIVGFDVLVEQV
jgi:hypothetical protein